MKDIELDIPEYNTKADGKLILSMVCVIFMPIQYGAFVGYLDDAALIDSLSYGKFLPFLLLLCTALTAALLFFLGYRIQRIGARLQKFEKPRYDPDRSIRGYIRLRKTLLALLFALAAAVIFFLAACAVRQFYFHSVVHETSARAKGRVYEIVAALSGFVTAYFPALLWFIPDDLLFAPCSSVLYYLIPIGLVIIPPVFMSVPIYFCLLYLLAYGILYLIRHNRIRSYALTVKRIKQEAEIEARRSRFD